MRLRALYAKLTSAKLQSINSWSKSWYLDILVAIPRQITPLPDIRRPWYAVLDINYLYGLAMAVQERWTQCLQVPIS